MNKIKKIIDYQKLHGTKQTVSWLSNNVKYRLAKLKSKPIEHDAMQVPLELQDKVIVKTKNVFIFATIPFYEGEVKEVLN